MITVLSYNIHKGFSAGNWRFVLGQIRQAIRHTHADLVFLQEVVGNPLSHARGPHKYRKPAPDWPKEPQFEYLADQLWPHYAYGKNSVYQAGHHGNAILSKYPILFSENINISAHRFENRGLLHAMIDVPGKRKPLHAICVHFGLFESDRRHQISRLCHRIETFVPHQEPLVIGGDFNDWRERVSRTLRKNLEVREAFEAVHTRHARTYPSWFPALPLDRVYFRGLNVRSAHCLTGTPWNALSDHAALVAQFHLTRLPAADSS